MACRCFPPAGDPWSGKEPRGIAAAVGRRLHRRIHIGRLDRGDACVAVGGPSGD